MTRNRDVSPDRPLTGRWTDKGDDRCFRLRCRGWGARRGCSRCYRVGIARVERGMREQRGRNSAGGVCE